MAARKKAPGSARGAPDIVRSSAVEYLTFIAASGEGGIEALYSDENVWLTQKMMAVLYGITVPTVSYHLRRIFDDFELEEQAVIRDFLTTATDGKNYRTQHYNLAAIIAVGYKVNSEKAVQFRKWATVVLEEYAIKGFAMESMARRKIPMTMADWEERLNMVLRASIYDVLSDAGTVTAQFAKAHAESEFEKYRIIQDAIYRSDFDRFLELESLVDDGRGDEEMNDGDSA